MNSHPERRNRVRITLSLLAVAALAAGLATAQSPACEPYVQGEAHTVVAPACVVGELPPSAAVIFPVELFLAGDHVSIAASLEDEEDLELCLIGGNGARLQCRRGPGSLSLVDLAGREGEEYAVHLRQGGSEPVGFRLELRAASPVADESEPNDELNLATSLIDGTAEGRWLGDEYDFYAFETAGEPQLWRFEAQGEGLALLSYFDGSGRTVQQRRATAGAVSISNLFLLPGRHYLSVRGTDSDYTLSAIPVGSPTSDSERESNEDPTRALSLAPGQVRSGTLDADDIDFYRFTLYATEFVRIEVEPDAETAVDIYLDDSYSTRAYTEPGQPVIYEALLLPGDHYLRLQLNSEGSGEYQVSYLPLDPLNPPTDMEPNDEPHEAKSIPSSGRVVGDLVLADGEDWYRLPPLAAPANIAFAFDGDARLTYYRFQGDSYDQVAGFDRKTGELSAELPAADDLRLQVVGSGPYEIDFDLASFGLTPLTEGQLRVSLQADTAPLSAYWHEGQRIEGTVTVENEGDTAQQVELRAASSHYEWRPLLAETRFVLAAGESRSVPLTVEVLPDARADLITRVTVGAYGLGSTRSGTEQADLYLRPSGPSATLEFSAVCGVPPLRPALVWPLPEPLLGGINLSWAGMGGSIAERDAGGAPAMLIDGMVAPSTGWQGIPGNAVTFRLAEPRVPVAGVLLNPYAHGEVADRLKDFEVQASSDGENFETILVGQLGPEPTEQAFLLDEPVTTEYLRLVVRSSQSGRRRIVLGEFKAVTSEASVFLAGDGADLMDPATGGYLVWTKPDAHPGPDVFGETSGGWGVYLDEGETAIEWAMGFHNDRAARVSRLEWVPPKTIGGPPLDSVEVAISLDSPIGPWTELGSWNVAQESTFELEGTPWVRFIRIGVHDLPERTGYTLPAAVKAIEAPVDGEYRTVLGEWGQGTRAATFEMLEQPAASVALSENDDNESMEGAQPLRAGEVIEGQVVIGEDVDWYRITVPEGENSLELTLVGEPVLGIRYELLDSSGTAILYDESGSSSQKTLSAFVEPGDYYLRLEEPPRSVVFAWDNSGSMGAYLDIIYQTITGFVREVQPGRETAQLLAFEEDENGVFLLPDWSDDPFELLTALNDYPRTAGSSNAEANLLASTRLLGEREGTRAIMFMTDAESPGAPLTPLLWTELERVRPRIFTFETSSAGSTYTQDLMQSWADVAGGYYDYARGVGDFEAGFDRATCHLRRPAAYRLEVMTEYREPPGPGLLSVVRSGGVAGNPPVELILDLSGSMSRALPSGASRVEVAKRVLDRLVSDTLPEGTPFALRMFGHVRPNSCDTRLDVPLEPLDAGRVRSVVAAAQPQLLSGTPLAASLLEVPRDLGSSGDGATVILLTDGEESCGGDVEAAVASLREAGLAVQLHIISFDVGSAEAKSRFADWAELGGGRFFDVNDEAGLAGALAGALQPSFEVVAADGATVAVGTVGGEPVSVPPGIYSIRLGGETAFEAVRVRGDDEHSLTLGAAR